MKIEIQPLTSLCDERINICAFELQPFGKVKISASMSFPWVKNREEARIKVENSKADILLFGGQKDGWWDAHDSCLKIMEKLAKNNYQHGYNYITYQNAGHACYAPYIIPVGELSSPLKIAPRLVFSEEVTWEANAHILEDS